MLAGGPSLPTLAARSVWLMLWRRCSDAIHMSVRTLALTAVLLAALVALWIHNGGPGPLAGVGALAAAARWLLWDRD